MEELQLLEFQLSGRRDTLSQNTKAEMLSRLGAES